MCVCGRGVGACGDMINFLEKAAKNKHQFGTIEEGPLPMKPSTVERERQGPDRTLQSETRCRLIQHILTRIEG